MRYHSALPILSGVAMKQTFLDFEQPIAELQAKIDELRYVHEDSAVDISDEINRLQRKSHQLTKDIYGRLTAWQIAMVARHPQRPYTLDYINGLFSEFRELHGDRTYADDAAIVGGLARFNGNPCMVIGHQKGRDTKEKIHRNFGMPRPEGYRKALRLMKLAEKFGLPLFTFIDTPGAYPGIGAEERGQSEAIGRNLYEMAGLRIPIVVTVIGEGGSGGALAIAIGDATLMLQYATYSGHLARRLRVDPVEVRRAGSRGSPRRSGSPRRAEAARVDRQGRQRAHGRRASRSSGDDGHAEEGADRRAARAPGSDARRAARSARGQDPQPMGNSRRSRPADPGAAPTVTAIGCAR
jgi:acetyl-CoA carboxylase carboxyl transferase alpha subunit